MLLNLDRRDTAVLKGLAISAIVFHNFFHAVSPAHQNEFSFSPERFRLFLETVRQPPLAVQAFFSFFGHFGVQIFIFLSAYGLAKTHWDSPESWSRFVRGRIGKLYPMFGLIVLPWFIILSLQIEPREIIEKNAIQLTLLFTGLSSLLPGQGLPPVGPWWFIAFIVQFYALWPLLRKLTVRFGWQGLLALSILCYLFALVADPILARWSVNLLETPIGHMRTICFGILAARYPMRIHPVLAAAGCAVLVLGSMSAGLWPFASIAALIVALWVYGKLRGALRRSFLLERLGEYSLLIFLLNGLVRNQLVARADSPWSQLTLGCLDAAISFALAGVIHEFLFPPRKKAARPAQTHRVPRRAAPVLGAMLTSVRVIATAKEPS